MIPSPDQDQPDSWIQYRRLVLAEIERLDRRADQLAEQLRLHEAANAEKFALSSTEIEVIKANFVGFMTEVKSLIRDEVRQAMPVSAPARPDAKQTAEYVRGMWEFRIALATGIVSILIAIIALLT